MSSPVPRLESPLGEQALDSSESDGVEVVQLADDDSTFGSSPMNIGIFTPTDATQSPSSAKHSCLGTSIQIDFPLDDVSKQMQSL